MLSIGRRTLPIEHPKLRQLIVDFKAIPSLPPVDDVFIALGTTLIWADATSALSSLVSIFSSVFNITMVQWNGCSLLKRP